MSSNVGTVDRALRVSVGLGLIAAASTGLIGAWGWAGAVPLLTALSGVCPLYRAVRLSSLEVHQNYRPQLDAALK
ncbi:MULTISPECIES: DUF2892 domain-containing protein [unclassified Duganella]|uniref:YgaP family membrane protein n=1 Tax=unclassified Duganella TaxID=2636909 RepID=UPI0008803D90|nr:MULTISPECIES: DUF2892 domain-containing protein [unclassified Duganella]SDG44036.1 Protein of unknown function [Duganella sp. OV458]SDJ59860.1 Protein of unknown function [Duganella sp. OV510]